MSGQAVSATEKNPPGKLPNEPAITPQVVAEHGLSPDEYQRVLAIMGRTPTLVELGIFSAMWSEHCSYKSSRRFLRHLPSGVSEIYFHPAARSGMARTPTGSACQEELEALKSPALRQALQAFDIQCTGFGDL